MLGGWAVLFNLINAFQHSFEVPVLCGVHMPGVDIGMEVEQCCVGFGTEPVEVGFVLRGLLDPGHNQLNDDGEQAAEFQRLKGQAEAVEKAMIRKECHLEEAV